MTLHQDDLMPGDYVSLDQYKSHHLGRLTNTCGNKEKAKDKFVGGMIGVNHATGLKVAKHQASYELEILSNARKPSSTGQNTLPV
jgi:hypothetical protein